MTLIRSRRHSQGGPGIEAGPGDKCPKPTFLSRRETAIAPSLDKVYASYIMTRGITP